MQPDAMKRRQTCPHSFIAGVQDIREVALILARHFAVTMQP